MEDIGKKLVIRVLAQYGVAPDDYVSISRKTPDRQVWRVSDPKGCYALKFVKDHSNAQRITAVNEYLHQKGVPVVKVLPTKQGSSLVKTDRGSFILFPWLEGKEPSYNTPGMIERTVVLLAQFHEASRGYVATGGPITNRDLDLNEVYKRKIKTMEKLRKKAQQMNDPFSKLFLSEFPWLRACTKWVLDRLPHTALVDLMTKSRHDPILGHSDYSVHNLLLGSNDELTIIDLDQVSIALPIVDISQLITWVNYSTGSWSEDKMNLILTAYQQVQMLSPEEQELILIDQIFPYRALSVAKWHFVRKGDAKSLERFERCLRMDREKIAALRMGPR